MIYFGLVSRAISRKRDVGNHVVGIGQWIVAACGQPFHSSPFLLIGKVYKDRRTRPPVEFASVYTCRYALLAAAERNVELKITLSERYLIGKQL